ncbi:transporter substrate-binding domain-containing protein [Paucibacter sp. R3-3]|uniref:Transporter substrate-binding domain-containing protein n=1 Tax=Roseateles agri TaxID=3098619 RepID=A0ABU5DNX3_9BURK|nr:transporter substrate-binding domain-containing protein [Paucibacter sp. R3-3]MDY0748015.1 transporter substrate-binding domain-containing protein [Paucibacter sp. R3-3]
MPTLRHLLLAALVAACGMPAQAVSRWHFVTEQFAPYSYEKDGRADGPMADVLREVCARLDVECRIEVLPWRRAFAEGERGEVDGVFSIVDRTEHHTEFIVSAPVVEARYSFFAKAPSSFVYRAPADLNGRTIGVYGPSASSRILADLAAGTNADMAVEIDNAAALRKLQAGRYGANGLVLANERVAEEFIASQRLDSLRTVGIAARFNYSFGLARRRASDVERFNQALGALCRSGRLQALLDRYRMEAAPCRR